ncbi:MAG: hypothetical protein AB1714_01225 [Acidobacteriota bacterium]
MKLRERSLKTLKGYAQAHMLSKRVDSPSFGRLQHLIMMRSGLLQRIKELVQADVVK